MKKCIKCGREIINGVNGCQLLNDCFDCRGGYPTYPAPRQARETVSWDELDALEDRCVNDWVD